MPYVVSICMGEDEDGECVCGGGGGGCMLLVICIVDYVK